MEEEVATAMNVGLVVLSLRQRDDVMISSTSILLARADRGRCPLPRFA